MHNIFYGNQNCGAPSIATGVSETELSFEDKSDTENLTPEQHTRISSFIGRNIIADNKKMIFFDEPNTINNSRAITLLESTLLLNTPTSLEGEFDPIESINFYT